jgi:hypothetical protein
MKFKVGDLCVVVADDTNRFNGEMVEVMEVGPMLCPVNVMGFPVPKQFDYRVRWNGIDAWYCKEQELKRYEPPSLLQDLVKMQELVDG